MRRVRQWSVYLVAMLAISSFAWQASPQIGMQSAQSVAHQASATLHGKGTVAQTKAIGPSAAASAPFSFEPNVGQAAAQVRFLADGSGYTLLLSASGAVMSLIAPAQRAKSSEGNDAGVQVIASAAAQPSFVGLQLVSSNPAAPLIGEEELTGKSNYFIGNQPSQWHTNVPHYARVRSKDVYPGIDMLWYGSGSNLEYDFVLAAGADANTIRLKVTGATIAQVGDQLALHTAAGTLYQRAPRIYQHTANGQHQVAGGYVLLSSDEVGFRLAAYDHSQQLVIDPQLVYSTYFGGSGDDKGLGITLDAQGDIYLVGDTFSSDFYTTTNGYQPDFGGVQDAFISKFSPDGQTLLYSTYLGGSASDEGRAIALDSSGNAYITGYTYSTNFPLQNALQPIYGGNGDAFVSELSADGASLLYSTYIGGSNTENGHDIKVDSSGAAYVTGWTASTDFTTTVNAIQRTYGGSIYDGFIIKLNPDGSLAYSTYLGGGDDDRAEGIALDSADNIYVTGVTSSTNFYTTTNALQGSNRGLGDAFVTELNAAGTVISYSTYLGGRAYDRASEIAVDSSGAMYITGWTNSTNFYTTTNAYQRSYGGGSYDIFAAKLNPDGSAAYSTFLGGGGEELGYAVTFDEQGNSYVVGYTQSSNFPLQNPIQSSYHGGSDMSITELNNSGSALLFSTYLGGSSGDIGFGVSLDGGGNIYVTGQTNSPNFPLANPFQGRLYGIGDVAIVEISNPQITPTVTPTNAPSDTATATGTATPTSAATDTPIPSATVTVQPSYTPGSTPSMTNTPTNTPIVLPTSTETPTDTPLPSATVTAQASNTPSSTPSMTNTPTSTNTPTNAPTVTNTPSSMPTNTPTITSTSTNTPPTTNTPTNTPTITSTSTNTPPATSTPTNTLPSTSTNTPTPTSTPTNTPASITTNTPTNTENPGSSSDTPTNTPIGSATPTTCPIPFTDISGNIFYGAIVNLYCRGAVNGTDATHYSPAGTSTRGQFAKVVVLGFGLPPYTPGAQDFSDVPPSYFAYLFIESGYHAGILSGFDQVSCQAAGQQYPCYLPNRPITRGQLTKLVVGAAHYPFFTPTGGLPSFTDVPATNVFFVSIETAHYKGVISGYTDATFRPNNPIRRDEMAQIVYKGTTTP